MPSDHLSLGFGEISHGWLPITVRLAGNDVLIDASDVPADPIVQLVSLARFLLSPIRGSRKAEFHLEPAYCVLTATKRDDVSLVDIQLVDPSRDVTAFGLSCFATATQIWRALRCKEAEIVGAINCGEWSWDFPSTQMALLSEDIETRKQQGPTC